MPLRWTILAGIALVAAGLGAGMLLPALQFRNVVLAAAEADATCADQRVASPIAQAITERPDNGRSINNLLVNRLMPIEPDEGRNSAQRFVMMTTAELSTSPKSRASALCHIGNAGGARFNFKALAKIVGVSDFRLSTDCHLAALATVLAKDMGRSRTAAEVEVLFRARSASCPI